MSLDVYQRLLALSQARAVPAASRAHRHLSPRPWLLTGYHLAGEPSAPVAIRYGSFRDSPKLLTVAEPRDRALRFAALGGLARDLATYLSRYTVTEPVVRATGNGRELDVDQCCVDAPQIVVPNEATAHWVGLLGQYLRTLDDPVLAAAGAHLGWIASRRHLPGSSVLLTATDLLTTHWRTGQLPTEDGHLGRLLAWIEPPAGSDAWQAARDAEAMPPAGRPATRPGTRSCCAPRWSGPRSRATCAGSSWPPPRCSAGRGATPGRRSTWCGCCRRASTWPNAGSRTAGRGPGTGNGCSRARCRSARGCPTCRRTASCTSWRPARPPWSGRWRWTIRWSWPATWPPARPSPGSSSNATRSTPSSTRAAGRCCGRCCGCAPRPRSTGPRAPSCGGARSAWWCAPPPTTPSN
ncbi:hypothetical protein ACFQZ4_28985 [Catellatospora coxensis]